MFIQGSDNLEIAIDNAMQRMTEAGLNVSTDPVVIPKWVRGAESGWLVKPRQMKLDILGLGLSAGTGPDGIESEILVVENFDELAEKASQVCSLAPNYQVVLNQAVGDLFLLFSLLEN